MIGIIDPLGRFSTTGEWRAFLDRILAARLPQDDPQVQAALARSAGAHPVTTREGRPG